jgi:hypothetical protein
MNVSETKVRRLAARKGYVVRKSRYRTTEDPSYGGYMLIEPIRNFAVLGIFPWPFCADLDGIYDWLMQQA